MVNWFGVVCVDAGYKYSLFERKIVTCHPQSGSSGYQRPPYQDYEAPLEGDIATATTPQEEKEFNTLDEPVLTTIVSIELNKNSARES